MIAFLADLRLALKAIGMLPDLFRMIGGLIEDMRDEQLRTRVHNGVDRATGTKDTSELESVFRGK